MNLKQKIVFLLFIVFTFSSCTNNQTSDKSVISGDIKNAVKHDTDKELSTQIIGVWDAIETAKGEVIVFDTTGNYKGYDGRAEFKGTWKIKDQKITLSLGGTYALKIEKDTMYMDESKYLRQNSYSEK
jgi:heat shock protein HslJ